MSAPWPTPNHRKPWTDLHDRLLREAYGKAPLERIARVLGRKPRSVKQRAIDLGITRPHRIWTEKEVGRLAELRSAGATMGEAAHELGRTKCACQWRVREMQAAGDPRFPKLRGGERA